MFQAIRDLFSRRSVKQPSMKPFEQPWVDTMPMTPVTPARGERPMSLVPGDPADSLGPGPARIEPDQPRPRASGDSPNAD